MNERIQELKIQACKWASENAPLSEYENACDEKFAELIVKECAAALINDSRLNDVRSAANGCVRIINEHFGVK